MREYVTDLLEILGLVLLVCGAALWTGHRFGDAAGVAVVGLGLVGASAVVTYLGRKP